MSRAFVKEPDGDEVAEDFPEKPRSPHTNYVTPQGLRLLRTRLNDLLESRAALSGHDDLASKQQIAAIERDLRYVGERIECAVLVKPEAQPEDRVHFGATVEVLDEDGARQRFAIVGEDETNIAQGKISWVSPLARALFNARVGDVVSWRRPAGDRELEVLSIHQGTP